MLKLIIIFYTKVAQSYHSLVAFIIIVDEFSQTEFKDVISGNY